MTVRIYEYKIKTVINSVTIRNFISKRFIKRHNLSTQSKIDSYKLIAINEINVIIVNKKINEETQLLQMLIQQHYKKLNFNVMNMIIHDIVLKML